MSLAIMDKTPQDRIDYDVDFGRWLTDGDTIVNATTDIPDPNVTFIVDAVDFTNEVVKVWVTGGLLGEQADITVDATTTYGRVKHTCFTMRIRDC
jgi:hypothetical protein